MFYKIKLLYFNYYLNSYNISSIYEYFAINYIMYIVYYKIF